MAPTIHETQIKVSVAILLCLLGWEARDMLQKYKQGSIATEMYDTQRPSVVLKHVPFTFVGVCHTKKL